MEHLIAVGQYVQGHVIGILLAIVASIALGFVWHGPLFGKQWMALSGITPPKPEDVKFSMMLPGLAMSVVMLFVQASVLGRAFQLVALADVGQAMLIAVIIWLPFTALTIANIYTWAGRPKTLIVLDAGYSLVSMLATAAILYATL